eukprot:TRINITY_DN1592_c0_g1_i2.p1 TRINITY_DN1592_c0_g1~~TRINITY_DN1592_c0_g1_i2.p1  ORF type:complete len:283 (-),score=84.80 TRINITY_DN1592_c0_g1_i2:236-1084(-)
MCIRDRVSTQSTGTQNRMASRLLFALVASVLCASAAADSYPLFSWTGAKGAFEGFEPTSASALIEAKHKGFKASIVYLHSLSTEQLGAHKQVTAKMQDCIQKSGSSIFRPLQDSSINPDELVAPYSGHVVHASEAESFLKTHSFSENKSEVVLIDMRGMELNAERLIEADQLRAAVEERMNQVTGGNYLSVLASTRPAPGRKLLWVETHNTNGTSPVWEFYPLKTGGVRYLNPNSLLGLGAALYMFFIALCGYCCLFSLQTPDLFEDDQRKEMARALDHESK